MPNIHIEGNIGTGKTTLLDQLEKDGYFVSREPVEKWQDIGLLKMYYEDSRRWSFLFQINSLITRMEEVDKIPNDIDCKIIERSIYSDKIFAKLCLENNDLNVIEYKIYQNFNKWADQHSDYKIDGFIYLRATPEICAERIKKRARTEESEIPLYYIKKLHQKHDDWLLGGTDIPVLVIDSDNFQYDDKFKNKLNKFIKMLKH